MSALAHIKMQL